jgi:hypothetical protein
MKGEKKKESQSFAQNPYRNKDSPTETLIAASRRYRIVVSVSREFFSVCGV